MNLHDWQRCGESVSVICELRSQCREVPTPVTVQGVADANGAASAIISVPASASGGTVFFQTLDRRACEVSNLLRYGFP